MPVERLELGRGKLTADTVDEKKIEVVFVKGELRFVGKDGGRMSRDDKIPPAGTIDSLKPLMKPAFNLLGVEQEEGYWVDLTLKADHSPGEACNILKRHGFTHLEATELVINSEPRILQALAFGDISQETRAGFVSSLASEVLKGYRHEYD